MPRTYLKRICLKQNGFLILLIDNHCGTVITGEKELCCWSLLSMNGRRARRGRQRRLEGERGKIKG